MPKNGIVKKYRPMLLIQIIVRMHLKSLEILQNRVNEKKEDEASLFCLARHR